MKILLAIDGSKDAFHAAEFFCRLPHDESMEIEVLSVINSPDVSTSTSTKVWLDEYMENLDASANTAFNNVKDCFEGSVATLTHQLSGHVGHQIVDRATETGAEMIVIGARGHSTVARLLLGSVSDYVGRHAPCSVLTVRPPISEEAGAETLRITICYDGSRPSERVLEQFKKFAWRRGVVVQVLTVVQIFPEFPAESVELLQEQIQQDTTDAEKVAEEVAERLRQYGVGAEPAVAAAEHIGEAIITAASEHHSQLILIGNTGRSLLPRLLLGSVSSYVVRHAKQSVWVVR